MNATLKSTLVILLSAALGACGSSSSGPGGTGGPTGPTGPSGVTPNLFLQGTISAKQAGSVVVNGITVSTTAAIVKVEKVERTESELKAGMVVKVKGHRAGAGRVAEGVEIEFEDAVKGKVSAVDDSARTVTVGGQLVRVDDSTEFEDNVNRLAGISSGQRVRVSGVADDKGGLRATRVEDDTSASSGADDFEVKGVVSAPSDTGFTLTVGGGAGTGTGSVYTVTLAAGASIPAGLADGSFVEVRSLAPVAAGTIVATSISIEDRLPGQPGGETEVEGIVTSGTSASFVVNGTTVTTSATTSWNGGFPDDLLQGVKVEAEGVLGSDGVLAAHKVTFKEFVRLFGRATGVTSNGPKEGSLTVNGVPARGDRLADWRTDADVIQANDWVELRGVTDRTGLGVIITRIEVKSPGNARPVIQGVVTAATSSGATGTVTILGKPLTADTGTELRGHSTQSGVDGPAFTDGSLFFAAVTAGLELVKVTGNNDADWTAGPTGAAREMELEGER